MDPRMQFGTGSPLLGGTSALNEAMARRGIDVSALQQVGSAAPTAQPMPQQPTSGVMGGVPQGAGQPLPQGSDEATIIINALASRLKSNSKVQEANSIPQTPKLPQQPQLPVGM